MEKRGQVSIFVIVGVVLVILIAIVLYLNQTRGLLVAPEKFLQSQKEVIQDHIEDCVTERVGPGVILLGEQGGNFDPANHIRYQGKRVKYFCQNIIGDRRCLNSVPPLETIQNELQTFLEFEINDCIDRTLLDELQGVNVNAGESINVNTDLEGEKALITVDWDVSFEKGGSVVELDQVRTAVEAPLEDLHSVARDVVQAHASAGEFDQLIYMLQKQGAYEINVDKPFPDTIYKVNKKNSEFEFWFAIEGESDL